MSLDLYPGLPLLIGAALAPLLGVGGRRAIALLAPALSLWLTATVQVDSSFAFELLDHQWIPCRADALSRVFALAFALYALIAGIYAWTETRRGPNAASLVLAAGGMGVVLAGDLLTLFFFWEMLTVASLFTIWFGGGRGAVRAGFHYVMVHLFGGVCLLTGILLHLSQGGAGMAPVSLDGWAGRLMLLGLMVNAAVPPLHAWLSDAYPRATVYGTVFLAAFTTKSAIYALARLFPGAEFLIWAGAAMTLYGVMFAVLENNIRRLLAYHIVSQVGYMVCGVGLGTAMAINGSTAHAFCHIFYKGLLLMSVGAVIHATGRERATQLGALARPLGWVLLFYMIGAFSISGVPLFNGFISKSMVVSAAAESHRGLVELMLIAASMGTFLSVSLKLPWFTFGAADHGARVQRPVPPSMYLAMAIAAAICIVTGVYPGLLYSLLPMPVDYRPFTANHVITALQLIAGTTLGFWLLRRKLEGHATRTLDTDSLYRYPLLRAAQGLGAALQWMERQSGAAIGGMIDDLTRRVLARQARRIRETPVPHIATTLFTFSFLALLLLAFLWTRAGG